MNSISKKEVYYLNKLLKKLPRIESDSMLLLNKTKHPVDTLYYCAACIINELDSEMDSIFTDDLFESLVKKYNPELIYNDFLLSLNFLYLIDKIELTSRGIKYVH